MGQILFTISTSLNGSCSICSSNYRDMEYQSIDSDQTALRQLKDLKRVDVQATEHRF